MTTDAAAKLLLRTRQALFIGTCALCGVWAWRGSGLVALFERTQTRWTGGHDTIFAVMFAFLTMFVVCMAIASAVTRAVKRRVAPGDWDTVMQKTTSLWDSTWKRS